MQKKDEIGGEVQEAMGRQILGNKMAGDDGGGCGDGNVMDL